MGNAAKFLRYVLGTEARSDLIDEAKAYTFAKYRECALIEIENGRRMFVLGGPFGIDVLQVRESDPLGRTQDYMSKTMTATFIESLDLSFIRIRNQPARLIPTGWYFDC